MSTGSVAPSQFSAVYQVSVAKKGLDQQKLEGAQAVALIDGTAASAPSAAPLALPAGATISIRA